MPEDHRQALVEALAAARQDIVSGDIDGLLSRWSDDVVIYPVAEPAVRGKDAARRYVLASRAAGIRPRITPTDTVAALAGDFGYVIGTHVWVNEKGEATRPGRYVTLWRRTEEGEWRMFLEIHSPETDRARESARREDTMNPTKTLLLIMVGAAFSQACANVPSREDHRQALIDTREEWGRAIAAGDVDGILSVWTDDVVIFPVSEPPVRGKEAVRQYMLRNRAQGIRPRVTPIEIFSAAAGDIGYVVGTHVWIDAEGNERLPGRYVTLWRRTEAGEWKCFLEIHSPDAMPESQ